MVLLLQKLSFFRIITPTILYICFTTETGCGESSHMETYEYTIYNMYMYITTSASRPPVIGGCNYLGHQAD